MLKKNVLNSIFCILITIILFVLLLVAVINILIVRDNVEWNFNYKMICCFFIIYSLIIYLIMRYFSKKQNNYSKFKNIIKIILIVGIYILQLVYAILIRRNIGFDCGVVYGAAIELVNGTFSMAEYFSIYGNNIFLLLMLEIIFRITKLFGITNYLVVEIVLNVIIIDIAILYIYKICKMMFGKKYCKICNFISFPLIGITPYISVVYSDTLSLIFPIAIFYNYLHIKNGSDISIAKRLIYISIFTIIGFLIKPTNVIILIAIIMNEIINMLQNILNKKNNEVNSSRKFEYKKSLRYIIYISITCILIYFGYNVYRNVRLNDYISKVDIEKNSFPMTHFFMMGLKPENIEGKYYGFYLEEDVQATKSQIGIEAKKEFNINEAKNRLKAMGIKGYLSYLYDKYTWIISDGTFFYGKEGNFYTTNAYSNSDFAKFIQNYTYRDEEGYRLITINIMQTIWVMVLIMTIVDICIKFDDKHTFNLNVLRLSAIGIILFILLFEARSRYLINHLPIFIILATSGIIKIYTYLNKEKVKLIENK